MQATHTFSHYLGALLVALLLTFLPQTAFGQTAELPSTIVTTSHDVVDPYDGVISLREAINYAQPGDTITFAAHLQDARIKLNGTQLSINKDVSIVATGQNITVDADKKSRVFSIGFDRTVSLAGLTVTGANGSGIQNSGNLTVTHSVIDRNSTEFNGGGIANGGTLTITHSEITGNSAQSGGGISNVSTTGTLTITHSEITGNSARSGGGINNMGALTITHSKITGNTALGGGGGIDNIGTLRLINSKISGNLASGSTGGGIANNQAQNPSLLTITNCTIAGNSAQTFGGGIAFHRGTLTINNTIVAGNSGNSGFDIITDSGGGIVTGWHNLVGNGAGQLGLVNNVNGNIVGTAANPIDPRFEQGDYFLTAMSLAVNRGNNALAVDAEGKPLQFDLDGNPRIQQGTVDMGAYESGFELYIPPSPLTANPNFRTEYITKEWVTKNHAVTTPRTAVVQERNSYDTGFVVDRVFTNWSGFGLYAEGLVTSQAMLDKGHPYEAILVFRGTTADPLDFLSDLNPLGVGFDQYVLNQNRLLEWAEDQLAIMRAKKHPEKLHVTGHSLGGALAQWFAADWTSRGKKLESLETFNSPGISSAWAKIFINRGSTVTHQVIEGDPVSLAGLAFIKDKERVNIYRVDGWAWVWELHASVWNMEQRPLPSGTRLSDTKTAAEFSSPYYCYPGSITSRGAVESLRVLAGSGHPIKATIVGGVLVVVDFSQQGIVKGAKWVWGKITGSRSRMAFAPAMFSDAAYEIGDYLLMFEFDGTLTLPGEHPFMLFEEVESLRENNLRAYHVQASLAEIVQWIENITEPGISVSLYDLDQPVPPLGIEALSVNKTPDGTVFFDINPGNATPDAIVTITLERSTGGFLDEPVLTTTLAELQNGWKPSNIASGMYYAYIRVECGDAIPEMMPFPNPVTIARTIASGSSDHKYEAVVTPPTCATAGFTTYTCSDCGDSYIDNRVEPLGHKYTTVVVEPTCTKAGSTTYTCSVCQHSYTEEIEAIAHDYEGDVTDPTCTEWGFTTYTCTRCGDSFVGDDEEPFGHDYVPVVTPPTCTEVGFTTYTCACGDEYVDEEVEILPHDYDWEYTDPTCTEDGYKTGTCPDCGDVCVIDTDPALGHDWGLPLWNGTKWYVVCKECGEIEYIDYDCDVYGCQRFGIPVNAEKVGFAKEQCLDCGEWYEYQLTFEDAEVTNVRVEQLNGNQNRLWITVLEVYEGFEFPMTQSFMIANNSAGTYTVGKTKVYVDTKGNTQIRAAHIVP